MSRDDSHVLDMLLAAKRAVEAVEGIDFGQFQSHWKIQSAVEHQLMILGEAVKRLSREFREKHSQFPWSAMAGHRDILVHHYNNVDLQQVWLIVTDELPHLIRFLESIVPEEGSD